MPDRTASEIINIYSGLGLSVCDDWGMIEPKVLSQRDRYLRDKNRSPDQSVRHRADEWFRSVSDLEKKRDDLIRIVYEHYADLAGAALDAGIAGGLKTLTPELERSLRQIAIRQCKCDDRLADRFLDDFRRQRGLTSSGVPLVHPAAVAHFEADSGFGQIELRWTLPPKDCDEVVVNREEEQGTLGRAARTVYRGRGTSHVDRDVAPGRWYRYRIHAVLRGTDGADTMQRALCIGDVRQPAAAWKDGHIELRWELPAGDATVLIFRRTGLPPTIRFDPQHGPRPDDAATTQVHAGSGTSWSDTHVNEGNTYFYRIIADFGERLYGRGVEVQAAVPRAAPPVPSVSAVHHREGDVDVVQVQWKPVAAGIPVKYLLVRREGSAPPAHPRDGTVLLEPTDQTSFRDELTRASGKRFTYAVFTAAAGRFSRSGTASAPVDILTEVSGLAATAGNGTVELRWQSPTGVTRVLVRRSLNPPRDHTEGALVPLTGAGHAKDSNLENGRRYHYLVSCGYRTDGSTEVFSSGIRVDAVPDRLPEPIKQMQSAVNGKELIFTWTPPPYGQAVLIKSAKPPGLGAGRRLTAREIDRLGDRVVTMEPGRTVDLQPDVARPYYTLFTVAGDSAIVGPSLVRVLFPDVSDLRVSATKDGVILRWVWPTDCNMVRIARRLGAPPEGPDDPQAAMHNCTRLEYSAAGEKYLDVIHQERARLHYAVYAQPAGMTGQFFSPGTDAGCQAVVQWEPWMTVSYQLASANGSTGNGKEIHWSWQIERPFANFSGLVLIASNDRVPTNPGDGIELARWVPEKNQAAGDFQMRVSLAPVHRRNWATFYCKAMVLDQAQRYTTLIVHPNPCIPITENGGVDVPQPAAPLDLNDKRPPKSVICPSCFEQFPSEEILYTAYEGGAVQKAEYRTLDRLLGRPPRPPRDPQGRVLPRKLCPLCKKPLPFTAGIQKSMVIGLIGAKFSGKSHYVASLIQQLEGRVGNDMQATLISVTEETPTRFSRDFFDPLFKNKLELGFTVGTPPPLVYDLTISGRLFGDQNNRAVTLALYDTAGENFRSPDEVRRMVKYVGVASGVMLLVDPLQLPAVRDALKNSVNLPEVDDPKQIVERVITELEGGAVLARNARLRIPVAVVLTKSDVLRDAGLIESNRLWCTDARHIGRFNLQSHRDMSGMVGEYVQRWHPALYSTVVQRFERHAFFGVSATGCAPDPKTRRYKYISPWRVEDPLLWLLAEMGVIPSR